MQWDTLDRDVWANVPQSPFSPGSWKSASGWLVVTPRKYLLARPNVLLIDDDPVNLEAFSSHGGVAVPCPRPLEQGVR